MNGTHAAPRGRWAVWAILIVFGLLFGVQTVRMRLAEGAAREREPWAVAVRPQNPEGQALAAEAALRARQFGPARQHALAAIEESPLQARALRVLAMVADERQAGSGQPYWRAAAALGWRDAPTQLWAYRQALLQGDLEVAIIRADAYLRSDEPDRIAFQVLDSLRLLASRPEFAHSVTERLAINPLWRWHFFHPRQVAAGDQLAGMVNALQLLRNFPNPPTRRDLNGAVTALIEAGRARDAALLDRSLGKRKPDSGSLIDDGDFSNTADALATGMHTPFDWEISTTGSTTGSIDSAGNPRLIVSVNAGAPKWAAQRFVYLNPGAYRLSYSTRGGAEAGHATGVEIWCHKGPRIARSPATDLAEGRWSRRTLDFRIEPGCNLIVLRIGSFEPDVQTDAEFDDISLTPARPVATA